MLPRHVIIKEGYKMALPNCPLCMKHLYECACTPEQLEAAEHRHYRAYVKRVAAIGQIRDMEANVERMKSAIAKAAECRQKQE